ncbi:MAG: ATP-dependent DNA helicase [Synergistales bacterium]|nr:ATP-dependent DNA helicase [Synergistales bacterium]
MTAMEKIFGQTGVLSRYFSGFEYRRQQQRFAEEVWDLLHGSEGCELLAAEAPTGVGKSFALLAPAMLWASEHQGRILFLTATITLQEQLVQKDIPTLNSVLELDLETALLKGRGRYLCLRRAEELKEGGLLSLRGDGGAAARTVLQWMEETETGDLEELPFPSGHPVYARIAAVSQGCLGNRCPLRRQCFVQAALRKAQSAQVVVANYHLFFSHIAVTGGTFPIPCDVLICDEAHRIGEAERSASKVAVSAEDATQLFKASPFSSARELLEARGLSMEEIRDGLSDAQSRSERLFGELGFLAGAERTFRESSERYLNQAEQIARPVEELRSMLSFLEEEMDEENPDSLLPLAIWRQEAGLFCRNLRWCLEVKAYPEWAYWWDGQRLNSAPVTPGEEIPEAMTAHPSQAIVAASATMAVNGSMSYWSRETGLRPDRELVLDSPFPLEEQMALWVLYLGVRTGDRDYDRRVATVVEYFVRKNEGRTLVLLGSYRLMNAVGEELLGAGFPYSILIQGQEPRSRLLERFRAEEQSVLVGTVSFREGVDVPGVCCNQVIIDRIPFSHPGEPTVEARNTLEGRGAFRNVTLPQAKLLLKQAVGRLIRSSTDTGRVLLLDDRAAERRDWKILESLPRVPVRRVKVRNSRKDGAEW